MRALRRSHTASSSSSSPSSSNSPSSSSLSWIHFRSVLLVVAHSSSSSSTSPLGSLKSPWSRRRRKHALVPKQWKYLFNLDGKFNDGGVKFLKKVRSGGVDPSIRAEVWPFLLGVFDLSSSKSERDAVRSQKRKEYENLLKQCRLIRKRSEKNSNSRKSVSSEEGNVERQDSVTDLPVFDESPRSSGPISELEADRSDVSGSDTDTTDSDSSEEPENIPLLADEGTEESGLTDDNVGEGSSSCQTESKKTKPHTDEDFATWQRIIRLDALRANDEWTVYSPAQAAVSSTKSRRLADKVGLKDYDHLEPCRVYHAARLCSILEAYALYDPEIGYCQGMSDLLSPIVAVIEEDYEAFWCFVCFMKKARHNFRLDEVGIRRQLGIVSKIIKGKDIHLYRHLENLEAEDCFFVYRMVVVLFRRELTFEQTLCLWEVMWADQAAIRAGIAKSAWGRLRLRAPPTDDLLLYAIAAGVLQRRKQIIEKYSSMDEIMRECNSMAGHLDVWKLLDDAHDLVVSLHDKI
ncbi:rab GTPase-activating protein 22-like isoform X3 [Rutidosis leptorrhynchoides]|uniref:rab GTPase-activating protein 22-like isoform X3 n=1 Tax=Rutidosis leptorrhynchoides TaxID=125765 RepID=UPI003A990E8E